MPTRKTKAKAKTRKKPVCAYCGKDLPGPAVRFNKDTYCCMPHAIAHMLAGEAQTAAQDGEVLGALFHGLGAIAADHLAKGRPVRRRPPPTQPPGQEGRRAGEDPFTALGLDPNTATRLDVDRVVRHFARLYHPDKGTTGVASDAMARINAHAARAKEILAKRRPST